LRNQPDFAITYCYNVVEKKMKFNIKMAFVVMVCVFGVRYRCCR